MNDLANIIQLRGLTGTAAEIVAAFGEIVETGRDSTPHGYSWVAKNFGDVAAESLLLAIQGAGLAGAAAAYCSVGFDLSDPLTQGKLDSIATAVPSLANLCAAIKAAGIQAATRWQAAGLESLPTEEDITTALQQIADRQAFVTLLNEVVNPLLSDVETTVEVFKSAVAAWGN